MASLGHNELMKQLADYNGTTTWDKTAEKYDNDGKADTSGWWNATMNFYTKYITFWHQEIAFRQGNVVREVSFIFEKEKYDITANKKIIVGVWFFFWDTRF